MPPTIATVLPAKGHTGGKTLVEITGTGFVLPPSPTTVPAPAPTSRMRVWFGDVEADLVEVADATVLYAFTPIHDPGVVDVKVQELAELPAELITGAAPFALAGGETLELKVGGGETQTVTIGAGEITSGAATPLELAVALNRFLGLQASVVDGKVSLRSDARGPDARLEVVGGTARVDLGLAIGAVTGNSELELVGDPVTAVDAYEFVLPDLTVKAEVTLVLEQLQIELARQVLPNVHFATHSDFDEETGDLLNTAYLAKLPGLILADVQLPDSRIPIARVPAQDTDAGENGTSVVREPEDIVDALVTLLIVAGSPIELFNLVAIMRRWARKNTALKVGECEYPLAFEVGSTVAVTAQRGGDNLQTATGLISIYGIPMGDIPIAYSGPMPAGVKQGARYESVTALGFPQTQSPNVGMDPK